MQIGQTSLELAEAAAVCPSDTFAAKSCVEVGGVEGCEHIEDSEGDSRLTFRECWGRFGGAAGERVWVFAVPRTLRLPRVLPEAMIVCVVCACKSCIDIAITRGG